MNGHLYIQPRRRVEKPDSPPDEVKDSLRSLAGRRKTAGALDACSLSFFAKAIVKGGDGERRGEATARTRRSRLSVAWSR
ncbi:hypothetical protein THAOC_30388, partial [Thalassiosira oceanica]